MSGLFGAEQFALLDQLNAWFSGLFKTSTWGGGSNPVSGWVTPEASPLLALLGMDGDFSLSSTGDSPLSLSEILGLDGWFNLPDLDFETILGVLLLLVAVGLLVFGTFRRRSSSREE